MNLLVNGLIHTVAIGNVNFEKHMTTKPLSVELMEQAVDAIRQYPTVKDAAKSLGIPPQTLHHRLSKAVQEGILSSQERNRKIRQIVDVPPIKIHPMLETDVLPDEDIDVEDLVEQRIHQYEKKKIANEARRCIKVKVKTKGPVGILWFGDPHVDDDGTDLKTLKEHTEICRETPAMFAANVGDTTNNWVGRLARLYATQGTTAKQAWMLAEWFIKRCPWLVIIGGNHDLWSGAGDPLNWITRGQTYIHSASEARFALVFPNGREVIVNSRHDFSGNSQWNSAHGVMKAIQLGNRDHISVAGHKHVSGYGVIKDSGTGRICHAIQVGSYKMMDRYAQEKGFRDQMISPCAVTIIDPDLEDVHPDMIKVFWNPQEARDYLDYKRSKYE